MSTAKKDIIIWGAGKIGRGFIADLFNNAGYHLTFIDASKELIRNLREMKKYTVLNCEDENSKNEVVIGGYEAYHTEEKEQLYKKLNSCSLMALAVFPGVFEQVGKEIAEVIEQRAANSTECPLDIIICTNMFQPSGKLKDLIQANLSKNAKEYFVKKVGLVDTLVIRMAVEPTPYMKKNDPLIVLTNGYPELTADKSAFKGELPEIKGLILTDNINAEEVRKMYTYNMIHAVYAYLGKLKGYEFVIDCTKDIEIQNAASSALEEVSQALQAEYGFSKEEMDEWNSRVLKNMANPILMDKIARVGGDPVRKLSRNDRLVGPALLCRRNGLMPYYITKAIAHGFTFYDPDDNASKEIRKYIEIYGIQKAVIKYCQLDKEPDLVQMIVEQYKRIYDGSEVKEDEKRIEKLKKAYNLGFYYEKTYKGCAQCTLAALFELTGRREDLLFQSASGLSGGIGICGDGSCGGYTGGVMLMSSYIGRRLDRIPIDGDKVDQYKSFEMAQKLHDRFIETYGSVNCADIHLKIFGKSYCLRSEEVKREFEEAGAHRDKCTCVIAMACAWIADILMEEGLIN